MSRRAEIIERANQEFDRAIARHRTVRAEILTQQRTALATVPGAVTAFDEFDAALARAHGAYESERRTGAQALERAERQAIEAQDQAEGAAIEAQRVGADAAEHAYRRAREDADRAFDAARRDAMGVSGLARDARLAQARREFDAAIGEAALTSSREIERVWNVYISASHAAREAAVAAIDAARRTASDVDRDAARRHAGAREAAHAALAQALDAHPLAAAIHEAFRAQLEQADRSAEAEKAAIIARMQRDLREAGL